MLLKGATINVDSPPIAGLLPIVKSEHQSSMMLARFITQAHSSSSEHVQPLENSSFSPLKEYHTAPK